MTNNQGLSGINLDESFSKLLKTYNPETSGYNPTYNNNTNVGTLSTDNPYASRYFADNAPKKLTAEDISGKYSGFQTAADVAKGIGGLASAYTGYKNYQLAKDQLGFEKALAQTNLANQAQLINEQRMNAANVGLGLAGSSMSPEQKAAYLAKIEAGNVAGKI